MAEELQKLQYIIGLQLTFRDGMVDILGDVTVVRQLAASGERLAKAAPTSVADRLMEHSQDPIALEAMDERDHDSVTEATTADDGEGS